MHLCTNTHDYFLMSQIHLQTLASKSISHILAALIAAFCFLCTGGWGGVENEVMIFLASPPLICISTLPRERRHVIGGKRGEKCCLRKTRRATAAE